MNIGFINTELRRESRENREQPRYCNGRRKS